MAIVVDRYRTLLRGNYSGRNEAIQFKTSHDIRMTGLRMYCSGTGLEPPTTSSAKVKLLRLRNDDETNAEEIGSIDEESAGSYCKTINFKESILIRANTWHIITGTISGTYPYGNQGGDEVMNREESEIIIYFRNSKLSEGTDVTKGQFPFLNFERIANEDSLLEGNMGLKELEPKTTYLSTKWIDVVRFASYPHGGPYGGRTEAIQFKTSCNLRMSGLQVFHGGSQRHYRISSSKVTLSRLINDDEASAEEIGSIDEVSTTTKPLTKNITFKESIIIRANIWHVVTGTFSGSYWYGEGGKDRVEEEGVVFEFRNSKFSDGTDVTIGQFPALFFKHLREEERLILLEKNDDWTLFESEQSSRATNRLIGRNEAREMGLMELQPKTTQDFQSEFLSKFEPIRILGQGGYGCVFEAEFKLIKKRYAVKRIPLSKRETDIEQALEEVMSLDSFEHPGIVRYNSAWIEKPPTGWQECSDAILLNELHSSANFEYRTDSVFLYIQMQLCNSTLAEWISARHKRDFNRIKSWFKQIVSAVEYIHKHNTMHRDLKPCNILLVSDDIVKICDLGIATSIENGKTSTQWRTSIGTTIYKAPEQTYFYDERVDIFSMGLILVELCAVLTEPQRNEIFNDIRCNKPITCFQDQPFTLDLITKLTSLDRVLRPGFEEIFNHDFFNE